MNELSSLSFSRKLSFLLMRFMINDPSVGFLGVSDGKHHFVMKLPSPLGAFRLILNPFYWAPELYSRGEWSLKKGDLAEFMTLVANRFPQKYKTYFYLLNRLYSFSHIMKQKLLIRKYTRRVKGHYDLSPDIYKCFLDANMVYTCALFEGNESLERAQQNKYNKITERLGLSDTQQSVLNIGFGWGSFEKFLVKSFSKIQAVGLSISKSQLNWAALDHQSSLNAEQCNRVNLLLQDYITYRPLDKYDAVTAIGMIEHVGQGDLSVFFKRAEYLLKEDGKLLVHTIIKPVSDIPTTSWMDENIFPGGYAPSVSEITKAAEKSELNLENIFIHDGSNYQRTLRQWRENLARNKTDFQKIYMKAYTFSKDEAENIFRQWEVYFASAEAMFSKRYKPLQIAHFVFKKS